MAAAAWARAWARAATRATGAGRGAAGAGAARGGGAGGGAGAAASAASTGGARRGRFSLSQGGGGGFDPDAATVWGLLAANGAVFGMWQVANPHWMQKNFTVSELSLQPARLHTLLTAAFSHRDFGHLASNMLGLYFFGGEVARWMGGRHLLALYTAAGLAGSGAHLAYWRWRDPPPSHPKLSWFQRERLGAPPALGASGAVNGVVLLSALMHPSRIIHLNFLLPVPAALLAGLFVLRDFSGLLHGDPGTGHAAHLGGAATGAAWFALVRAGLRL